MGVEQSTTEQLIYPQSQPICATEPRFCLPHNVQLHLKETFIGLSGDGFTITDSNNKQIIYFQCGAFSLGEKIVLRDNMGVPVLNTKEKICSLTNKFDIFAGEESERQICKFRTKITLLKAKLSTVFPDIFGGIKRHLVLKSDLTGCMIYLGEPTLGGIPLARIFRPLTMVLSADHSDGYIIEIAANVDIAICVVMCIALDEHGRGRRETEKMLTVRRKAEFLH